MNDRINVLVFPAGEINSIELHEALSTCININLFGASSINRHGQYVFKNYISGLPLITAPGFLSELNVLLRDKNIHVVFPTHDTVAAFFANNREKIDAKIIVADKATSAICRDKAKIYRTFADCDFTPKVYESIVEYPVFAKPREGQGAVGGRLIESPQDVPAQSELDNYVICEYLPGEEYTVDCLTDKNNKLVFVSPRSRKRVLGGVSVAGQTEPLTQEIQAIAERINGRLRFMGLWFFQIKKDARGEWKLLEISTRVAGSMCLTRARGVNLPLLSVYVAMGYEVTVQANPYQVAMDRTLISRYKINYEFDTVYIDFDDTLIIGDKVNLKGVWFLYQCQNLGKSVILLTKHEKNIYETLRRYHLDSGLFNSILHVQPESNKADYIDSEKAVFVDNSYRERETVFKARGVPVFDVDGLDVLLDWRV